VFLARIEGKIMSDPFERILLATEHTLFDSGSERLAFDLARRCGVPLAAVMPVLSNPEYEVIAPQLAELAEQEAAAKIRLLYEAATIAGVQIEVNARRGAEPYREIVQEAADRQSDLIVIRRRGERSFLSSLLVGEMVSKVVAHSPCNVLFVPRDAQMWSHGVLAGVDNSPNAEHVAHTAAKVALRCELPLTLVSVISHEGNSLRAQAESTLGHVVAVASAAGVQAQSRILVGKPFEQMLSAAKNLSADLIVVGRHGESNLIRTPFGGTTHKVAGLANIPVLVVRS
jgi:nucleotide-binding universal stress UspA family protein